MTLYLVKIQTTYIYTNNKNEYLEKRSYDEEVLKTKYVMFLSY